MRRRKHRNESERLYKSQVITQSRRHTYITRYDTSYYYVKLLLRTFYRRWNSHRAMNEAVKGGNYSSWYASRVNHVLWNYDIPLLLFPGGRFTFSCNFMFCICSSMRIRDTRRFSKDVMQNVSLRLYENCLLFTTQ